LDKVRIGLTHDFIDKFPSPLGMGLSWLQENSCLDWEWFQEHHSEVQSRQIKQLDAVISLTPKWTRNSLVDAERLLLIARWGVGYDNIDLEACTEAGVMVTITPDAVKRPVATANTAMVLALSTALLDKDRSVRQRNWRMGYGLVGSGLKGKCLGSIGFGNIAKETFRLMQGFEMDYLAYSPRAVAGAIGEWNVRLADLDTVLRESDYLLINCPLNSESYRMISASQFALMKRTSYLINLARGAIVDESALIHALQNGRIAGAALDVFEQEPLPEHHPFLTMDQVILSPHSLAITEDLTRGMAVQLSNIFGELLDGRLPPHVINREVLDSVKLRAKITRFKASTS
jgi:phosphoglycerate dehydrogenase-like enzyme